MLRLWGCFSSLQNYALRFERSLGVLPRTAVSNAPSFIGILARCM